MKKLPYKEGDWFAVPLGNDRYGVGVIARAAPRGKILLGYFFDRFFQGIPQLSRLEDLTPDKAIEVVRFGDLSLFNREWPVLGSLPDWESTTTASFTWAKSGRNGIDSTTITRRLRRISCWKRPRKSTRNRDLRLFRRSKVKANEILSSGAGSPGRPRR